MSMTCLLDKRRVGLLFSLILAVLLPFSVFADDYEGGYSGSTNTYGKSLKVGDPVAASNGSYTFRMELMELGGPFNLSFSLFYRHDMNRWGPLPQPFWAAPLSMGYAGFEIEGVDYASLYLPNGDSVSFQQEPDGDWVLTDPVVEMPGVFTYRDNRPQVKFELVETEVYLYLMDPDRGIVYIYEIYEVNEWERELRLAWIVDRNGNTLTYTFEDPLAPFPIRVEDGLGRSLDFTYELLEGYWIPVLTSATDAQGRTVFLNYEENASDNADSLTLRSVTDAMGRTTAFSYAGDCWGAHRIDSVQYPAGNVPYRQEYVVATLDGSDFCRVGSQLDAAGNATDLSYEADRNRVTENRADGTTWQYEHYSFQGYPKSMTDPEGEKAEFEKNDDERLTSVNDRTGGATTFEYHPDFGVLTSMTNRVGETIRWTYEGQDQTFVNPANAEQVTFRFPAFVGAIYPDGTQETHAYDEFGNMISSVDRRGATTDFEVDSMGNLTRITNSMGGEEFYTYNADGTMASSADSGSGVTTYTYDPYRRLSRITNPDSTYAEFTYNDADEMLTARDELGRIHTFEYDGNGNTIRITDSMGGETRFEPDDMDRVERIALPGGGVTAFTYDAVGRLSSVTDAVGNVESYGYDSRGRLSTLTDGGGNTWRWAYDQEGGLVSTLSPMGRTETFQTDGNGWLTAIVGPMGHTSSVSYDSSGRPLTLADRMGRTTTYAYDGAGLITGVTDSLGSSAAVTRDGGGMPVGVVDFNGGAWSYGYTQEGRFDDYVDPLGNRWEYDHNDRGLLSGVNFPDGTSLEVSYDAVENETRWAYSDGTAINYTYDGLDRLTGTEEAQIAYDSNSRVVGTVMENGDVFGATYDAAGKLTEATYAGGLLTVAYSYDARNLLTRVEDDLTNTWMTFAYDADGDLTRIERSNGASTDFTRDEAGRIVSMTDQVAGGPSVAQVFTRNAEGEITSVDSTGTLDPLDFLTSRTDSLEYDAANRMTSGGYATDEQGRCGSTPSHEFSWDGAGRMTGLDGGRIDYNGLGDPVRLTEGGKTEHYSYNYALGGTPVVAEREGSSPAYGRFYVYAPDGGLLYAVEAEDGNAVRHFHFDAVGSTLFLTGEGGGVTDRYAYSPYGKLIGHEGTSDQSYTYVGRWGVRALDGDLYMMGARVYAAAAGRFLTPDPAGIDLSDPRSLNLYQYALQDPVNIIDPMGEVGWNADRTVYTSKSGQFIQTEASHGNFLGGWKWVPNPKPKKDPPPPVKNPPRKQKKVEPQKKKEGVKPKAEDEGLPEAIGKACKRAAPEETKCASCEQTAARTPEAPPSPGESKPTPVAPAKEDDGHINVGGTKMDPKPLKDAAVKIAKRTAIEWVKNQVPGAFGKGLSTTFRLAGEAEKLLKVGKELTVTVHALVEQRKRIKKATCIDTSDLYPGRRDLAKGATWFKNTFWFLY